MNKEYLPESRNASQRELQAPNALVKLPAIFDTIGNPGAASAVPSTPLPAIFDTIGGGVSTQEQDAGGFVNGVMRSGYQLLSSISNLLNDEESAKRLAESAENYPAAFQSITDIKSIGDIGAFAIEAAGESIPSLAAMALGALAGATLGVGATLGAVGTNVVMQLGESKQAIQAAGGDPSLVNVGTPAVINTAIDSMAVLKILKKAGLLSKGTKIMDEAAEASGLAARLKDGAKTGVYSFGTEGSTEVLQNYINMVAGKLSVDEEVREALSISGAEGEELLTAFAKGGLGAATLAAPVATVRPRKKTEAMHENKPEDETAQQPTRKAPVQPTETDVDTGEKAPVVKTPAEVEQEEVGAVAIAEGNPIPEVENTPPPVETAPPATQSQGEVDTAAPPTEDFMLELEQAQARVGELIAGLQAAGEGYELEGSESLSVPDSESGYEYTVSAQSRTAINDFQAVPQITQSMADLEVTTIDAEGRPTDKKTSVLVNAVTENSGVYVSAGFTKTVGSVISTQITRAITNLQQKYMPDAQIFLTSPEEIGGKRTAAGQMMDTMVGDKQVYFISLNPRSDNFIYDQIVLADSTYTTGKMDFVASSTLVTAMHEFGHALLAHRLIKEDNNIKLALYKEHATWIANLKNLTFREFVESRFSAHGAEYFLRVMPTELLNKPFLKVAREDLKWDTKRFNYMISFEEYASENFARISQKDKALQKELSTSSKQFWKGIYDSLQRLFKDFKKLLGVPLRFGEWVELQAQRNLVDSLINSPLKSSKLSDKLSEMFDGDIGKFKDALNLPIENAVRFNDNVGSLLDDAMQVEAIRRNHRVSTGFTRRRAGTFLTPSQIAERYNIKAALDYMKHVYEFHKTKMRGISKADEVSKDWISLPQKQADNLGKFIFAVSERSDDLSRKLTEGEILALRERYGVTDAMYHIHTRMEGTFTEILDRLERSLVKDVVRQYVTDADTFVEQWQSTRDPLERVSILASRGVQDVRAVMTHLKQIEDSFTPLRNKNYFPRMRFGTYTITKKDLIEREDGSVKWVVTEFETFESKAERDSVLKEMQADNRGNRDVDIQASKLDDTTKSLYGMPQLVVDRITQAMRDPELGDGLTPAQEQALADISIELSPGRRYLRHLQKRKNTAGFSREALRTYAAYMVNASNHLARVEHTPAMTESLRELGASQREFQGDVTDLAEMESYFTDHFKYLLNPENDWAKLRAFGFLWYLGFNPKSAIVNTTQLPMVTYPYLASRYGDAGAVLELIRAIKDVVAHYLSKKPYTEAEQRMMDKLLEEGVIDESMASDLAGLSEGTALQRVMSPNKAHRVVNNINYYGGYLFSVAEKFNRQVTALATMRLHQKVSNDFDAGFEASKTAIHKSQFEYAKYNRPEFMRGRKSAFLLFYNYTQQFLYMAFAGGKTKADKQAALRVWAMLFMMSGAQGLPFAEYILSMLDIFGTQFKKWTGMDNPKVDVRRDLRELITTLTDSPDAATFAMHGAGRFMGAGPLKLLEMFGAPVPNLDISGSLSMGEPLPGFRTNSLQGSPQEVAGQILLNGLGPIPNIALEMWNGVSSTDPDVWKRMEKAMPVFGKNLSKAVRFGTRGAETSRGSAEFLRYDGNDPYEAAEIIAQGLGFTATRLSQKREMFGEQMNTALYWSNRRQLLMERYAYAITTKDIEAKKQAMEDIRSYNKSLKARELKPYIIGRESLRDSLRSKQRVLMRRERGLPTNERDRLIYRAIQRSYEGEQ